MHVQLFYLKTVILSRWTTIVTRDVTDFVSMSFLNQTNSSDPSGDNSLISSAAAYPAENVSRIHQMSLWHIWQVSPTSSCCWLSSFPRAISLCRWEIVMHLSSEDLTRPSYWTCKLTSLAHMFRYSTLYSSARWAVSLSSSCSWMYESSRVVLSCRDVSIWHAVVNDIQYMIECRLTMICMISRSKSMIGEVGGRRPDVSSSFSGCPALSNFGSISSSSIMAGCRSDAGMDMFWLLLIKVGLPFGWNLGDRVTLEEFRGDWRGELILTLRGEWGPINRSVMASSWHETHSASSFADSSWERWLTSATASMSVWHVSIWHRVLTFVILNLCSSFCSVWMTWVNIYIRPSTTRTLTCDIFGENLKFGDSNIMDEIFPRIFGFKTPRLRFSGGITYGLSSTTPSFISMWLTFSSSVLHLSLSSSFMKNNLSIKPCVLCISSTFSILGFFVISLI